jgi:hypothetical protein
MIVTLTNASGYSPLIDSLCTTFELLLEFTTCQFPLQFISLTQSPVRFYIVHYVKTSFLLHFAKSLLFMKFYSIFTVSLHRKFDKTQCRALFLAAMLTISLWVLLRSANSCWWSVHELSCFTLCWLIVGEQFMNVRFMNLLMNSINELLKNNSWSSWKVHECSSKFISSWT